MFDLAGLGVARARLVEFRDLAPDEGSEPTAGFDVHAVGAVYLELDPG